MKMLIGIAAFMIDYFVHLYSKVLTLELGVRSLHKRRVFVIIIVTFMQSLEVFSCGLDQKLAKKYGEGQVHEMYNQTKFGSLSFMPTKLRKIR